MDIRIHSLLEGARAARGTAVIIDVFRAYTTAAVAFSRGAEKIILVAEVAEALELRERGAGSLCVGEVDGIRPEGFDFGNSPFELSEADVAGATLIQSTRAGTTGAAAATGASRIYVCSFAIASATARAVLADAPDTVSIVAMGDKGRARTDEDELCAIYLRNLLEGRASDHKAIRSLVESSAHAANFGDPSKPWYYPMDMEMALRVDSYPFAIRVAREGGLLIARAFEA